MTKFDHRVLDWTKCRSSTHRNSTLHTAMTTTRRCKTRCLERENLIGSKLLLIKSLLLLLQCFNLILDGNLRTMLGYVLQQTNDSPNPHLFRHYTCNFTILNLSCNSFWRKRLLLLLLLRELEADILFIDRR